MQQDIAIAIADRLLEDADIVAWLTVDGGGGTIRAAASDGIREDGDADADTPTPFIVISYLGGRPSGQRDEAIHRFVVEYYDRGHGYYALREMKRKGYRKLHKASLSLPSSADVFTTPQGCRWVMSTKADYDRMLKAECEGDAYDVRVFDRP